uniref:Uncharacterized protein n=2 Tax=Sphaerodactylus townsendi TaxID=933632 RepID=A0ACB8F0Z8_9SAUR
MWRRGGAPSLAAGRRRQQRQAGLRRWAAGEEEEEERWARSPSPRRGRWEEPGPEEPPAELAAGPRPSPPHASWGGRRSRTRLRDELWDRPNFQKPRGSPAREAAWDLGQPRGQRSPGLDGGGSRWSGAERTGGEDRRSPSPGQAAWDSPRARRRQQSPDEDARAWRSPRREASWESSRSMERRPWEQRQGSPSRAGGRWGSTRRGREGSMSSSRERSWASPVRSLGQEHRRSVSDWSQPGREQGADGSSRMRGRTERRGRESRSPARKQSSWDSPKRGARQECAGSPGRDLGGQGQVNSGEAGSRWSSLWYGKGDTQSLSRDQGRSDSLRRERQSPNGEARGWGSPAEYRRDENVGEIGAEKDNHGKGGKEKRTYAAGSGSSKRSPSPACPVSGSLAAPKRWTPCESVVHWWMHCWKNLQATRMKELNAVCPRPILPDKSSATPLVNMGVLSMLDKSQRGKVLHLSQSTRRIQNQVLNMLGPAMTVCEMAEEAIEKAEPVDPMELREWSRHLIRFIASINHQLTMRARYEVLGAIDIRLRSAAPQMKGQSTEGMLFAEDKEKLLKEIIMRFPQLSGVVQRKFRARRAQRTPRGFTQAQRGFPLGSHSEQ